MSAIQKVESMKPVVEAATRSAPAQTDGMISMLERVLLDPSIPVERLERLLELQAQEVGRRARTAFMVAMAEMQPELPVIGEKGAIKNKQGETQSTYAKWADVNEAIMPVLKTHGFSLTFKVATPEKVTVTGILSHREGHSEETSITLPHDSSGSKNPVQAVASSVQYGKRYTAGALLNLTSRAIEDTDDDGQAGGAAKKLITDEQEMELRDMLLANDRDEKKFCERIGVPSLADIFADKFADAKRLIEQVGARR